MNDTMTIATLEAALAAEIRAHYRLREKVRRAVDAEQRAYKARMDSADWFNNNTPGVGQTVEYRNARPMPDWVLELEAALLDAEDGRRK